MQTLSQLVLSFRDGGPVMWPILILSVVGAAIVFDRLFAFRAFFRSDARHPDPQAERNLFGEKYFESARHYYECLVGEPRTFEIGIRAAF